MSAPGKAAVACGVLFTALVATMLLVRGFDAAPRPGALPWLAVMTLPATLAGSACLACLVWRATQKRRKGEYDMSYDEALWNWADSPAVSLTCSPDQEKRESP